MDFGLKEITNHRRKSNSDQTGAREVGAERRLTQEEGRIIKSQKGTRELKTSKSKWKVLRQNTMSDTAAYK